MVAYSAFWPGNGMLCSEFALMLVPSVAFSVFRIAPVPPATLTVVAAAPTDSLASILRDLVNLQVEWADRSAIEPGCRHGDGVISERQKLEIIEAAPIGGGVSRDVGGDVGGGDIRSRYHSTARIGDRSSN